MMKKNPSYVIGVLLTAITILVFIICLSTYIFHAKSLSRTLEEVTIASLTESTANYVNFINHLREDGLTIQQIMDRPVFREPRPIFIINSSGEIVASNRFTQEHTTGINRNFFVHLNLYPPSNGYDLYQVRKDIEKSHFGYFSAKTEENGTIIATHAPLFDNLTLVNAEFTESTLSQFQKNSSQISHQLNVITSTFIFSFIILMVIGFICLRIIFKHHKQEVEKHENTLLELGQRNKIINIIATILSKTYSALFYVNLNNDKFIEYRPDKNHKIEEKINGEDFFGTILRKIPKLVYGDDQKLMLDFMQREHFIRSIAKSGKISVTFRQIVYDEPHYFHLSATRPTSDLNVVLIVVMDVDKERRQEIDYQNMITAAEDERKLLIKEYHAKLDEAKANVANAIANENIKTKLLASINHHASPPLNAIITFAKLLRLKKDLSEADKNKYLDDITFNASMLINLINNAINLNDMESDNINANRTICDFNGLCDEMIVTFKPQAVEKGLQMFCNISDLFPIVEIDIQKVSQIIFILLYNALKFTEHGFIWLNANFTVTDENTGTITFSINDTGCGFPTENATKLIKVTLQDHKEKRDTSVGLSLLLCKQLTKVMNGTINVKSEIGHGTTITIVLKDVVYHNKDASLQTAEKPVAPVKPATVVPSQTNNILIVDDSTSNATLLLKMLNALGFSQISVAYNADEAIELMRVNKYLAVFTDMWMPGMTGAELLEYIRNIPAWDDIPVIVVTGDSEMKKTFKKQGFNNMILKPFGLKDIRNAINKLGIRKEARHPEA